MLDWLASFVTTRRAVVLGGLIALAVSLAVSLPNLRVDPSVENLLASYEGEGQAIAETFRSEFGDSSLMMVVVHRSENVLAQPHLQYQHELAGALEDFEGIEAVVSLTRIPLPRRRDAPPPSGGFDDLEDELGGDAFGDLEAELDESEGQDEATADLEAQVVDSLVALVEANPERFPGGFQALGPRLQQELIVTPVVEGDSVEAQDIEELEDALRDSMLEGRLISEDRTVSVTALKLEAADARTMGPRVDALRQHLEANPPPSGAEVHLGGIPYLRSTIVESIRGDQIFLVPMTILVCLLLLAIALRWLPGVVLPILAVGITAIMVVGGMATFGQPLNVLNNIIPTLLIIIGISDSIHLIARYREELEAHRGEADPRLKAGRRTLKSMASACLLTSVTTSVGLASLVVSKTVMLRQFGLTSALGVMVAYVVTVLFLPAVLTWVKTPGPQKANDQRLEEGIGRLTHWVLARPWPILGFAALTLVASIAGASQLKVDHAVLDQFDPGDAVYQTTRLLEDKLDGIRPLEISIQSDDPGRFYDPELLASLDGVLHWAEAQDAVLSATSANTLLRQSLALLAPDEERGAAPWASEAEVRALSAILESREGASPLAAWVNTERTHYRMQIKVRDIGAQATMVLIEDLQRHLDEAVPGDLQVGMTGEAYDGSVGMDAVVGDLLGSLLMAVVIIFVLLTLLFRSLRFGLLSIPPNVIPLAGTMAYMALRGIPLNAATGIVFSISLGLAVDGSIHVLARFREELAEGKSVDNALLRAAKGTGRAIVISSVTLMAGFAVLLLSNFVPVRLFGELIAITVGGCLFATLLVQPALLKVAGAPSK